MAILMLGSVAAVQRHLRLTQLSVRYALPNRIDLTHSTVRSCVAARFVMKE